MPHGVPTAPLLPCPSPLIVLRGQARGRIEQHLGTCHASLSLTSSPPSPWPKKCGTASRPFEVFGDTAVSWRTPGSRTSDPPSP